MFTSLTLQADARSLLMNLLAIPHANVTAAPPPAPGLSSGISDDRGTPIPQEIVEEYFVWDAPELEKGLVLMAAALRAVGGSVPSPGAKRVHWEALAAVVCMPRATFATLQLGARGPGFVEGMIDGEQRMEALALSQHILATLALVNDATEHLHPDNP
ncbi:hypothetical protein T484DRAFT_1862395 [Baffinella frigidus]|nr:hypothetical protein T484DRAFT_1862395 [Cryptophyta sp. CCMP2293]